MNLMKYPRGEYSIDHFSRPSSWELEGKSYELVLDDGADVTLSFSGRRVSFSGAQYDYLCVKADESTYLVSFELSVTENHTYVLDLAQRLVTRLVCRKGLNPKNRHMMDRQFTFGAIRMRGYKLPYKRHSETTETLGTTVQWRWSPEMYTKHAYLESAWYRITWDDDGAAAEDFDSTNEMVPATDEKAKYIKIKDGLYMFSLTEETLERLLCENQHFRCNNMVMLQNYDRMYQVGRIFGDMIKKGKPFHLHKTLCSYGSPVELPEEFLNAENPYTV